MKVSRPPTIHDECIRLSAPGVEVLLDVSCGYPVVLHGGAPTAGVTPAAGLALEQRLAMTPQGVLLLDTTLTNTGSGVYALDELAVWLPVPDRATQTLDFAGRWLRERQPHRLPMAPGLRVREGREGRTGHDSTIVQCAVTDATTTETGEAWGVALLWSGNAAHMVERDQVGRGALGAGELLEPGEVRLAPGESYTVPTVAALYSNHGLDGMGARAHEWLRARPEHADAARPVALNVWEAVYFNHDLATLTALVHGVVAADGASAVFAYVQCATTLGTRPSSFRLPGLLPGAPYRVRGLTFGGLGAVAQRAPLWVEHGVEAAGAALATIGLRAPILWPEEALLVVVERSDA